LRLAGLGLGFMVFSVQLASVTTWEAAMRTQKQRDDFRMSDFEVFYFIVLSMPLWHNQLPMNLHPLLYAATFVARPTQASDFPALRGIVYSMIVYLKCLSELP
jgi:hypothetical protein